MRDTMLRSGKVNPFGRRAARDWFRPWFQRTVVREWWGAGIVIGPLSLRVDWRPNWITPAR